MNTWRSLPDLKSPHANHDEVFEVGLLDVSRQNVEFRPEFDIEANA